MIDFSDKPEAPYPMWTLQKDVPTNVLEFPVSLYPSHLYVVRQGMTITIPENEFMQLHLRVLELVSQLKYIPQIQSLCITGKWIRINSNVEHVGVLRSDILRRTIEEHVRKYWVPQSTDRYAESLAIN